MVNEAKLQWNSTTVDMDKHQVTHRYNARILAKLLIQSLADDFSLTIIMGIPLAYLNDGLLYNGFIRDRFCSILPVMTLTTNIMN